MATVVTLSQVDAVAVSNRDVAFMVTVSNTGSSALTLSSLSIGESSESDVIISQPLFMTPQMPVGLGNPVISAGGSVSYVFGVVFSSPNTAGASPNAPGPLGSAGMTTGQPADNSFSLLATAQTSDGVVGTGSLVVSALSATAPFPRPEGGAFIFTQGSNLVNGIILGVL